MTPLFTRNLELLPNGWLQDTLRTILLYALKKWYYWVLACLKTYFSVEVCVHIYIQVHLLFSGCVDLVSARLNVLCECVCVCYTTGCWCVQEKGRDSCQVIFTSQHTISGRVKIRTNINVKIMAKFLAGIDRRGLGQKEPHSYLPSLYLHFNSVIPLIFFISALSPLLCFIFIFFSVSSLLFLNYLNFYFSYCFFFFFFFVCICECVWVCVCVCVYVCLFFFIFFVFFLFFFCFWFIITFPASFRLFFAFLFFIIKPNYRKCLKTYID